MSLSSLLRVFLFVSLFLSFSSASSVRMSRDSVDPQYSLLEPLLGVWNINPIGDTLTITKISYEDFYSGYIALGRDQKGYLLECLIDEKYFTTSSHTYICWNFESSDASNDAYYNFSFIGNELQGMYYFGEFNDALESFSIGKAEAMSAQKHSVAELLNSDLVSLKNILVSTKDYSISGSFAQYDFEGVSTAFDWTFTTPTNSVYQLQGVAPSSNDVFGWKSVQIIPNEPAWYMSYLEDWDGDGSGKYDWVLVGNGFDAVYKLEGVTETGNFAYSDPLEIKYEVSADKKSISFGSLGPVPGNIVPSGDVEQDIKAYNELLPLHAAALGSVNNGIYSALEKLSDSFSKPLDTSTMTQDEINGFTDEIVAIMDETAASMLYSLNFSTLDHSFEPIILSAGTQLVNDRIARPRFVVFALLSLGVASVAAYKRITKVIKGRTDPAKHAIEKTVTGSDEHKAFNSALGLDDGATKVQTLAKFNSLGLMKKLSAAKKIEAENQDPDHGSGSVIQEVRDNVKNSAVEVGKIAVNTEVGFSTTATGGQFMDKIAQYLGASATVAGLIDLQLSIEGWQPLDLLGKHLTVVSNSNKKVTLTIDPPVSSMNVAEAKAIMQTIQKGDLDAITDMQLVLDASNVLSQEIAQQSSQNPIVPNSDGSLTIQVPEKSQMISLENYLNEQIIELRDHGLSDLYILIDGAIPQWIKDIDLSENQFIEIKDKPIDEYDENSSSSSSSSSSDSNSTQDKLKYTFADWSETCPAGMQLEKHPYNDGFYKECVDNNNKRYRIYSEYYNKKDYSIIPFYQGEPKNPVMVKSERYEKGFETLSSVGEYEALWQTPSNGLSPFFDSIQQSYLVFTDATKTAETLYITKLSDWDNRYYALRNSDKTWYFDGKPYTEKKYTQQQIEAPNDYAGGWRSIESETNQFYSDGITRRSQYFFDAKLQADGDWSGVSSIKKLWHEDGSLSQEDIYTQHQYGEKSHQHGDWVAVYASRKTYYDNSYNNFLRTESQLIPKEDNDGSWFGRRTYVVEYDNSPNNYKINEAFYDQRLDGLGRWTSLAVIRIGYAGNGIKSWEDIVQYLLNSKGDWQISYLKRTTWISGKATVSEETFDIN